MENTVRIDLRVTEWVPVIVREGPPDSSEGLLSSTPSSGACASAPTSTSQTPALSWFPSAGGFTFIPTELLGAFVAPAYQAMLRKGTTSSLGPPAVVSSIGAVVGNSSDADDPWRVDEEAEIEMGGLTAPSLAPVDALREALPFTFAEEGSVPFQCVFTALEHFVRREMRTAAAEAYASRERRGQEGGHSAVCEASEGGGGATEAKVAEGNAADDAADLIFLDDCGLYRHAVPQRPCSCGQHEDACTCQHNTASSVASTSAWEVLHGCSVHIRPQMNPVRAIVRSAKEQPSHAVAPASCGSGDDSSSPFSIESLAFEDCDNAAAPTHTTSSSDALLGQLMEGVLILCAAPTVELELVPLLRRFQWLRLPLSAANQSVLAHGGIVVDGGCEDSGFITAARGRGRRHHLGSSHSFRDIDAPPLLGEIASATFEDGRAVVVPSLLDVSVVAVSRAFPFVELAGDRPFMRPFFGDNADAADMAGGDEGQTLSTAAVEGQSREAIGSSVNGNGDPSTLEQRHRAAHSALQAAILGSAAWAPPRVCDDVWCLVTYPDGGSPVAAEGARRRRAARAAAMAKKRMLRRGGDAEEGTIDGDEGHNSDTAEDCEVPTPLCDASTGANVTEGAAAGLSPSSLPLSSWARAHHLVPSGRLWRVTSVRRGWEEITPSHRAAVGAVIAAALGLVLGVGRALRRPSGVGGFDAASSGGDELSFSLFSLPTDEEQCMHTALAERHQQQQQRHQQYHTQGGGLFTSFANGGGEVVGSGANFGFDGGFQFCSAAVGGGGRQGVGGGMGAANNNSGGGDEWEVATRLVAYGAGVAFAARLTDGIRRASEEARAATEREARARAAAVRASTVKTPTILEGPQLPPVAAVAAAPKKAPQSRAKGAKNAVALAAAAESLPAPEVPECPAYDAANSAPSEAEVASAGPRRKTTQPAAPPAKKSVAKKAPAKAAKKG